MRIQLIMQWLSILGFHSDSYLEHNHFFKPLLWVEVTTCPQNTQLQPHATQLNPKDEAKHVSQNTYNNELSHGVNSQKQRASTQLIKCLNNYENVTHINNTCQCTAQLCATGIN